MRKLSIGALAMALVLPTATLAQTTTTCRVVGNEVVCESAPSVNWQIAHPPQINMPLIYQLMLQKRAREQAQQEAESEEAAREAAQERARSIGAMINAGKCDEAKSVALDDGDIDLASKIAGLCPIRPAAPNESCADVRGAFAEGRVSKDYVEQKGCTDR